MIRPTFVDMDPPEHTKQRGMIEPYMTPEAVEKLRPHIQKIVDEEIDAMVKKGSMITWSHIPSFILV